MSPKHGTATERTSSAHGGGRMARHGWKLLLAVDVVLLAALGIVQFGGSGGDVVADVAEPMQTAELSYHADVEPSDTYPDGTISTGETVFTSLIDRVDVSFRHSTDAAETVTGTARLDAVVSTSSGWETTRELVEPTAFDSGGAELDETLVLPQIRDLAERVAEATGVPTGTISIVVTASGEASLDGEDAKPFSVDMPLQLDPLSLTLTGETSGSADDPVVAATAPLAGKPEAEQSGRSTRDLRSPLLIALLLSAAATVVLWPTTDDDGDATPVAAGMLTVQLPITTARIEVDDREALRAIASTVGRPVVRAVDWEGVLTADALYWYDLSDTEAKTTDPTTVPSSPALVVDDREPMYAAHQ